MVSPMVVLYIFLGILAIIGVIVAALLAPVRVYIRYTEEDGLQYLAKYFWHVALDSEDSAYTQSAGTGTSSGRKSGKRKKKKTKSELETLCEYLGLEDISSITNAKKALEEKGLEQTLADLSVALRNLFDHLGKFLSTGVFKRFTLRVAVGDEDAAEAAMSYGKLCGIIYPTVTWLDSVMHFRRRTVDIRCDFQRKSTAVIFDGQLNYRLWHILVFLWVLDYLKRSIK